MSRTENGPEEEAAEQEDAAGIPEELLAGAFEPEDAKVPVLLFAKGLPTCLTATGGKPRRNLTNAIRCNSAMFETPLPSMVGEFNSSSRLETRQENGYGHTQVGTHGNHWYPSRRPHNTSFKSAEGPTSRREARGNPARGAG